MLTVLNKLIRSLHRRGLKVQLEVKGPSTSTPAEQSKTDAAAVDSQRQRLENEAARAALRRAATEKEQGLAREAASRTIANHLDSIRKFVPALAVAYGLLVTFLYFFRAIGFFPSGLSVGDTVLFVFVALGFGLFGFLFVGAGSLNVLPALAHRAGAKKAGRQDDRAPEVMIALLFAVPFPICVSLLLWLAAKAHESWFDHGSHILEIHLALAGLLGVLIAWLNWMHGARGMVNRTPLRSIADWLFAGAGYGFFYLFVAPWTVLAFPAYMPFALGLSFCAGLFMWLTIDALEPIPKAAAAQEPVDRDLEGSDTGESASRKPTKQQSFWMIIGLVACALAIVVGAFGWWWTDESRFKVSFVAATAFLVLFSATYAAWSLAPEKTDAKHSSEAANADEGSTAQKGKQGLDAPTPKGRSAEARLLGSGILVLAALGLPLYGDLFQFDAKLSTAVTCSA